MISRCFSFLVSCDNVGNSLLAVFVTGTDHLVGRRSYLRCINRLLPSHTLKIIFPVVIKQKLDMETPFESNLSISEVFCNGSHLLHIRKERTLFQTNELFFLQLELFVLFFS